MTRPSFTTSVCHATSPSVIPPAPSVCPSTHPHIKLSVCHMDMSICCTTHQSVCQSTRKSVTLSVHTMASPSVIPIHPSYDPSVHHHINSSMTHQSVTLPISPAIRMSDSLSPSDHLYTILHCPADCPTSSDHLSTIYTSPSDHLSPPDHLYDKPPSLSDHPLPPNHLYDKPPSPSDHPLPPDCLYDEPTSPSACLSPSDSLTTTTTHPTIHPSSHTMHHTKDSSQSLAVVNGEQSCKAKKFHRAFTNYNLLLCALDVSSIYLSDSRCVAPPKSGEDAHVTHGRCDLGGTTLNKPRLGFSYVLPRLWDPGGVRSTPNVPIDQSRTIAPSRYLYKPCKGHLVNLTSLQRWQDLCTSHVKLDNFIHRNNYGLNNAMMKIPVDINANIPALM